MHKLWIRITSSFFILTFILLLISGLFIANVMKKSYFQLKEDQLIEMSSIVIYEIEQIDSTQLQNKVEDLSSSTRTRFTIINTNGEVIADSMENPALMDNHLMRPEVQQVLTQNQSTGLSIRDSETLGTNMMYVTVPFYINDELAGVVRSSLSLEFIEQAFKRLWMSLFLVLFAALLLTGLIGMRIAKGISEPVEKMINVSERLKEKDYSARVDTNPQGELGQLAKSINVLASSLESQLEQIQENEQLLSGVLANLISGVMLVDTDGRVLLANRAMGEMIGKEPDQLISKLHVEVSRNAELSHLIDQSIKSGSVLRSEVQFFHPKNRLLDAHLAPFIGEKGDVKGIILVLHDITDIRRLEKMRSEFVANVSHELKTPITSVKGFAETLLDGAMEDPELCRNFLTIIHDESNRLHRLISDILYLSSIEHHHIPLRVENVPVVEVINSSIEMVKERATQKEIHISAPEYNEDVWIEGEKDRLQQILLNLLSNAVAYTPVGGEIKINVIEQKKTVQIFVSDNGIGIPKKDLPRIFERFYRVDKARSRVSGGTGLGLAIVKHLVDSHHGKIDVESIEGEGTIFTVTLPKKIV